MLNEKARCPDVDCNNGRKKVNEKVGKKSKRSQMF